MRWGNRKSSRTKTKKTNMEVKTRRTKTRSYGRRKEVQTDRQRHRPTEKSSSRLATGFMADSLGWLGVIRPACRGHSSEGEKDNQSKRSPFNRTFSIISNQNTRANICAKSLLWWMQSSTLTWYWCSRCAGTVCVHSGVNIIRGQRALEGAGLLSLHRLRGGAGNVTGAGASPAVVRVRSLGRRTV